MVHYVAIKQRLHKLFVVHYVLAYLGLFNLFSVLGFYTFRTHQIEVYDDLLTTFPGFHLNDVFADIIFHIKEPYHFH